MNWHNATHGSSVDTFVQISSLLESRIAGGFRSILLSERSVSLANVREWMLPVLGHLQHWASLEDREIDIFPMWLELRLPLLSLDLLGWLSQQSKMERIFWLDRERVDCVVGVGIAHQFQEEFPGEHAKAWRCLQQSDDSIPSSFRYWGGMRFDTLRSTAPHWQEWGHTRWILPRWLIEQQGSQTTLSCFVYANNKDELANHLYEVELDLCGGVRWLDAACWQTGRVLVANRTDCPTWEDWNIRLDETAQGLRQGEWNKVVWARETRLSCVSPPDPLFWLAHWREHAPHTFLFLFQPGTNSTFVGATPERLYTRNHREVYSEALAGTSVRGSDPEQDEFLAQMLLQSPKNRHEQKLVLDVLESQWREICSVVEKSPEPMLRKLQHVQHLWTPLRGVLREGVTDLELLQRLHPTPAVGGWPKQRVCRLLAQKEPFDRGWYAAPVGWFGVRASEFAVALRSALIRDRDVYLYAGAGIVPGSESAMEWEELSLKQRSFQEFFVES